jgi:hypothetical protein
MAELKLVRRGDELKFKKQELDEDSGVPIAGWISSDRVGMWLNNLRGLDELNDAFGINERPKINEDHIILYENGRPIGWVDRKHQESVENRLWNYLKDSEVDEVQEKVEEPIEPEQLGLFS